jgi:hypothetical protein
MKLICKIRQKRILPRYALPAPALRATRPRLQKTGSFNCHRDWHASSNVKIMRILAENNFNNQIPLRQRPIRAVEALGETGGVRVLK